MHEKRIRSPEGKRVLATIRGFCAELSGVSEAVDAFGHTSFRIRDKPFVMLGEGEHGASVSVKADPVAQKALLEDERFYETPYIGRHGWVSFRADAAVESVELRALVLEAFERVAPPSTLR